MTNYSGTDDNDVLNGSKGADSIDGGAGADIINSGAGDDVIFGGEGDDKLNAGAGDDILYGGVGNDVLNGGGGSDRFVFNFTVTTGQSTVTFAGFNSGSDGKLQQNEFMQQYNAFLVANGIDPTTFNANGSTDPLPDNPDGSVESALIYGGGPNPVTHVRYYENTLYISGQPEISASDGHDTITSFQNAGQNVDSIVLNGLAGLSDADLDALFNLTLIDTNGDGIADATSLVWGDGMGSIQIGGTTEWGTDVLAFLHDGQVLLA